MYPVPFHSLQLPSSISIFYPAWLPSHSKFHSITTLSLSVAQTVSITPATLSHTTRKMSRAAVELDFFGLEKEKSNSSRISKSRRSQGIQRAISRINPELIKSVITSTTFSAPSTPKVEYNALPPLPVYIPVLRPTNVAEIDRKETAPLTIFYNGTVTVFDVCPDKAENILKLAAEASSKIAEPENKNAAAPSSDQQQLLGTLGADLPLFRRKSLERFLEKRKERLTSLSPYACDDYGGRGFGRKMTSGDKFDI